MISSDSQTHDPLLRNWNLAGNRQRVRMKAMQTYTQVGAADSWECGSLHIFVVEGIYTALTTCDVSAQAKLKKAVKQTQL